MIQRIVARALHAPVVVMLIALGIVVGGLFAFHALDVEAYPNPVPPLVEVITQPVGWSAEEVERYVTIPLEVELSGMKGLDHIRSQSIFGLSDVKCYFQWGFDYDAVRQEVINRLQFISLPNGLQAQISPWNAIGEVFRYRVVGEGYTLEELKSAEDWILERQFKQVPGVIDVTSFGGETKQYQVNVDPDRLRGQNATLTQLTQAVSNANENVGGQRLTLGEQSFDVRGIGLLRNLRDIGHIVLSSIKGTAVRVRDVAEIETGHAPRLGKIGFDDDPDVVQGIVLMRYGGQTGPTLAGIYRKVAEIEKYHLLPPGMRIAPYYDRGSLVNLTTRTVTENTLLGIVLVTIVLMLFLGSVRAALITAVNIPLALLFAISGMVITGTAANLISLGAVDFGIVIDSTVIMIENIYRHLGRRETGTVGQRILAAAGEVGGPMAFSTAVIATAFLPLFLLSGVEGVIFSPMARTYALAIGGALCLAVTLTPVVASKFVGSHVEEKENWLMGALHRIYQPAVDACLRWPRLTTLLALIPIILCTALFPLLGREFMPKLEEGNLWIRATMAMSISFEESSKYVDQMRRVIRGCPTDASVECTAKNATHPEVLATVSQVGRPDDGTDVSGFYNIEIFAPLKPLDEFPRGLTKAKLTEQLSGELSAHFPGVIFNFSQMISDNVEEALSGIKGENSVKIVGPDIKVNEGLADAIEHAMSDERGVTDLGTFHSLGQPELKITVDREACDRYGVNSGDVDAVIEAAIGGTPLTQVYEGERHYDLTVRWQEEYRNSIDAIRAIDVPTPDGIGIPLGQLATVELGTGPSIIYREDLHRYTPVKFSVRGHLGSTVEAAQRRSEAVRLPYDVHLEWAGQINELRDAERRLVIIIPLSILLICVLVYSAVNTWIDTVIVIISIPLACTGGILALLLTRENFSVSAAMGFVSVFGIAVQDAILIVTYFHRLRAVEGLGVVDAAREAAAQRFRPVLMTTLVAMVGLLPAALSRGIGAQTQKPLAIVVIGGSFIIAAVTRVIAPPMLVVAHGWYDARREAASERRLPT